MAHSMFKDSLIRLYNQILSMTKVKVAY